MEAPSGVRCVARRLETLVFLLRRQPAELALAAVGILMLVCLPSCFVTHTCVQLVTMYVMVVAALLLTEPHSHKSSTAASSAMCLVEHCTESSHEESTNVTLQYLQLKFTTSFMASNNLGQLLWSRALLQTSYSVNCQCNYMLLTMCCCRHQPRHPDV